MADGYAVFVTDYATCVLVSPLLIRMRDAGLALTIYAQDDPTFPDGIAERLAVEFGDIRTRFLQGTPYTVAM